MKEAKRMRELVQQAINTNQIEQDLPGLILERVTSPASTKQAMIARVCNHCLLLSPNALPINALAASRPRPPSESIILLWIWSCHQELMPSHLPRNPRSYPIYNVRCAVSSTKIPHFLSSRHYSHDSTTCHSHTLSTGCRRLSFRLSFIRPLHYLPKETTYIQLLSPLSSFSPPSSTLTNMSLHGLRCRWSYKRLRSRP